MYIGEIDNLIALSKVLDDFKEFNERVRDLVSIGYNRKVIYKLEQISKGEESFNFDKIRQFYNDNKTVIDVINEYSSIYSFICSNYDVNGNVMYNDSLNFFYSYMQENRDGIDSIVSVLERIKELGFSTLYFNQKLEGSNDVYSISTSFNDNDTITYLDNMEVVSSDGEYISYRALNPSFRLILVPDRDDISKINKRVEVDSLLFDKNLLPESISKDATFNQIMNMGIDLEKQKVLCKKM